MAITFVNGGTATATNGGDPSVNMSGWGLQEDDLVIGVLGVADEDQVDHDLTMTTTGYTEVVDLFSDSTFKDAHLGVFRKFMGATPDTTAVGNGPGGANEAVVLTVMAFRGVDTTTPLDVTTTTATGTGTPDANPPSIDHNGTAGIWTLIAAAAAHGRLASDSWTFPTGYTTNAQQAHVADSSVCSTGMGYNSSPSDPEDPAVMDHSGANNANQAWCAATLALRPAAAGGSATAVLRRRR